MARREIVDDAAAGDRRLRRVEPDDQALIGNAYDRRFEAELNEIGCPWGDLAGIVQNPHAGERFDGSDMDADALARPERADAAGKDLNLAIDRLGRAKRGALDEHHSALDLGVIDAAEIDRGPLPRMRGGNRSAVCLDPADADGAF